MSRSDGFSGSGPPRVHPELAPRNELREDRCDVGVYPIVGDSPAIDDRPRRYFIKLLTTQLASVTLRYSYAALEELSDGAGTVIKVVFEAGGPFRVGMMDWVERVVYDGVSYVRAYHEDLDSYEDTEQDVVAVISVKPRADHEPPMVTSDVALLFGGAPYHAR